MSLKQQIANARARASIELTEEASSSEEAHIIALACKALAARADVLTTISSSSSKLGQELLSEILTTKQEYISTNINIRTKEIYYRLYNETMPENET
jgi:hypothetical protein